ncbi:putative polypeptide N-acetylgalactosaminyltransferase-like protein 3 [Cricetulus griseus]|uniref:Putative polypeptide N-acetylgalactosaminyltransferase-like protein 3 n=1 Tax=Cricetulus griseus TaxID=10029 RepID=A0A061I912_CRIGR|nr:putative polypeptide N-acetylgalactosaminyltransferase-like protein 3 [Cricetulus griseus]
MSISIALVQVLFRRPYGEDKISHWTWSLPYNCNWLSKSLGLIEGYGGRGKGGLPATLSPSEEEKAKGPHEKYGYNSYLSEKISLDRSIPDYRPTKTCQGDKLKLSRTHLASQSLSLSFTL